jgi:hypothetical protein
MVTETDDSRLGRLEGQIEQLVLGFQDVREEIRATNIRVDQGFQDVREEIRATNMRVDQGFQDNIRVDQGFQDVREEIRATNNRIDRLTLAVLGVGGGVIVALISLAGILAIQLIRSG